MGRATSRPAAGTPAPPAGSGLLAVLALLYRGRPRGVAELVRDAELSRPTTEKALARLIDDGLVVRSAPARGGAGRPATLYRFDDSHGVVMGIDVAPHQVRVRVDCIQGPRCDVGGAPATEPAASARAKVSRSDPAPVRLAVLAEVVAEVLADPAVAGKQVWAATAATPGIVDSRGDITECAVYEPDAGWEGDVLRSFLRQALPAGTAIGVENDANLAALAEYELGCAAPADEVVVIQADSRIAFGVLRRGVLYRGAHGQVGEVANLPQSRWWSANELCRSLSRSDPDVYRSAGHLRDGRSATSMRHLAHAFAPAIAELGYSIDPELIVLGGASAEAGSTLLRPIEEHLRELWVTGTPPALAVSPLGGEGVLLGAADHARRAAQDRLFAAVAARTGTRPGPTPQETR
jgi:predicted NBD/HSP70 family sugar kinase